MFCCFSFLFLNSTYFHFSFFYFVSIYFIFCSLINPSLFFTCFILFFWQCHCQTKNDRASVKQKMTVPLSKNIFIYIYIYMQFVFACFCCFFLLLPLCLVCTDFSSIFLSQPTKTEGSSTVGGGSSAHQTHFIPMDVWLF